MKRFERRRIPGVRPAPKKELRELSKLPWVVDEAHSDPSHEIRVLPDGRMLDVLRCDGSAMLYPSREAFEQALQWYKELEAEAAKGPFDPAKELLPPLDDFLRDVERHAKSLAKVLRLPDEVLDRSVESLGAVHKAVVRIKRDKRFTPEVFTPLTAYVGEVMRLLCDGRWGKLPATIRRTEPAAYDPAELKAYEAAFAARKEAAKAAGEKAATEAKAKGASKTDVMIARDAAERAIMEPIYVTEPKPIRYREVDEPVEGHQHEPVVWPRGSGIHFVYDRAGRCVETWGEYPGRVDPARRRGRRSRRSRRRRGEARACAGAYRNAGVGGGPSAAVTRAGVPSVVASRATRSGGRSRTRA